MHDEIERLRSRVETSPGDATFPLLADALRRTGRLEEAMNVAATGLAHSPNNVEGRVALGLALLEMGDTESARRELAEVLERLPGSDLLRGPGRAAAAAASVEPTAPQAELPDPPQSERSDAPQRELSDELGVDEIDRAFAAAEPEEDQMLSANTIAERAIEDTLAQDNEHDEPDEPEDPSPVHGSPAFMTETMAHLLERQGDTRGAQAIRSALEEEGGLSSIDAAEALAPPVPELAPDPDPDQGRREDVVATLESWLRNLRRGTA